MDLDSETKEVEENNDEPYNDQTQEIVEEESTSAITFYAMCGIPALHTIIVCGSIYGKPLQVLIDSGSTHNFIDCNLVWKIQLEVDGSKKFEVLVANSERL